MVIKVVRRMLCMCDPAYFLLKKTLILCCVLVFCAFVYMIEIGEVTTDTYYLYMCAVEMTRIPAALLLTTSIATVVLEDHSLR